MKEVICFGGSFNPIHCGHIALAKYVLEVASINEVWFIPSPLNPLKKEEDLLPELLRKDLVSKAISPYPQFKVCDLEYHLPKPSYTYQTLNALQTLYPKTRFHLLIGGDNWQKFSLWKNHSYLLQNYPIWLYPRQNTIIDTTLLPPNVHYLNAPFYPISSTLIREKIKKGEDISSLVPQNILTLIETYYR